MLSMYILCDVMWWD